MRGTPISYSAEELAFLERHAAEPRIQLRQSFAERFDRHDVTVKNIERLVRARGWSKPVAPIGHRRLSRWGYWEVKVHRRYERGKSAYIFEHRQRWEAEHGPVPEGMALKCRGDRNDTSPSNWMLIPRAMLTRLNGRYGRGFDTAADEVKPTILAVAKLEHRLYEMRRVG